jgi:hypothetical protein
MVPGTKCSSKIFEKFIKPKNLIFGPGKVPKKNFFLISIINYLGDLSTGIKGENLVFLGFSFLNTLNSISKEKSRKKRILTVKLCNFNFLERLSPF